VEDDEVALAGLSLVFEELSDFASLDFASAGLASLVFATALVSELDSPLEDSPFAAPSGPPLRCAFLP
jgi:hypothetical protein